MIFNGAFFKACGRNVRRKLFYAFILINFLPLLSVAQINFTRNQFSGLTVLTRARFFENEILKAASKEGVDPNILWTIAYNETRFRPWLTSPKRAQGLMQFIPSTAARFDLIDPYEPLAAIRAAAGYVKVLSKLFGGRVDSILAAYNSGEGTVSAYLTGQTLRNGNKIINPQKLKTIGGIPPYQETVGYVGRGLKIYAWLIRRGTFPASTAGAIYPTVISWSVARASVIDAELGKLADFNNLPVMKQSPSLVLASKSNNVILPTVAQNNQQKFSAGDEPEIYYDPRTGTRYRVLNGTFTKLTENGRIVVDGSSRPVMTNKARSTFFAVQPSK